MLVTDGGLAPIVFSLAGYYHLMMDIGCLFCNIKDEENRFAIINGYTDAGGRFDLEMTDASYAFNILLGIAFQRETCPREEWFAPRLEVWQDTIFLPLAKGKMITGIH